MTLDKAIENAKKKILKKGMRENLGQKELREIKDKYFDTENYATYCRKVSQLEDWINNLSYRDFR